MAADDTSGVLLQYDNAGWIEGGNLCFRKPHGLVGRDTGILLHVVPDGSVFGRKSDVPGICLPRSAGALDSRDTMYLRVSLFSECALHRSDDRLHHVQAG